MPISEIDLAALVPFAHRCGIELLAARPEEVRGRLVWDPTLCTAGGVLHGGAVMTLADTLGAVCAHLQLRPGTSTFTIESKTNFLRALRGGHAEAISRPLHAGRTTIVVQTDVFDEAGRRIAQVTQTQAVVS